MKKIIFFLLLSVSAYGQVKISDYPKTTNTTDTSNYIPLIQRYGSGWKNYRMSVGLFSLPSQTGNSGKYLTTNGTTPSWASVNSAIWGNITGTLSNQTDLNTALGLNLKISSNLSDLANAGTARTNLGLGTVSTKTAPSGTNAQLLANDGSGGFSNVTIGSGLSYSAGTLTGSGTSYTADESTLHLASTTFSLKSSFYSQSSTASTLVQRDANSNVLATNFLPSYTSTATAAGTTTLTSASAQYQDFTGSTTQTVVLPVASTLSSTNIHRFVIENLSTGVVTVQTSGGNTVQAMGANSLLTVKCVNPSGGTGTASWTWNYFPPSPMTTKGDIIYGETPVGGYAPPTRLAAGTSSYVLTSNGAGTAPSWQPSGGLSGMTTNRIQVAGSSTSLADFSQLAFTFSSPTSTLTLGNSSFIFNASTGEQRWSSPSSYFPTFYSNGVEVMRFSNNNHKAVSIGSTSENAALYVVQPALSSSWLPACRIDPGAHTAMTASTAFPDVVLSGATETWGSGTIAIQPKMWIKANTLAGTSGTNTATIAAGLQVDPWVIGTNAAITSNYSIYSTGVIGYDRTITAGGTTGNQTINKPTGTVNIAASGTSVTVTNNMCTASSLVFAVIRTNDATATIKNVVPSAGSFVITLNAATTAEVSIGFMVVNN